MIREPEEAQRIQRQYIEARLKMWINYATTVYTMGVRQIDQKYVPLIAAYKVAAKRGQQEEMKADLREALAGYEFAEKRFSPEHYAGFVFEPEIFIYVGCMCDNFFEANQLLTFLYLKNCSSFKEMCTKYLPNGYPDYSTLLMCWDQQQSDEPEHKGKINLTDCVNSVNNVYQQLHGVK